MSRLIPEPAKHLYNPVSVDYNFIDNYYPIIIITGVSKLKEKRPENRVVGRAKPALQPYFPVIPR